MKFTVSVFRRWKQAKKVKTFVLLLFTIIFSLISSYVYNRIVSAESMVLLRLESVTCINNTVSNTVGRYRNKVSSEMLYPTYNGNGELITYTVNSDLVSKLEAEITDAITKQLKAGSAIKLTVPIGTLLNNPYLSGKGPKVVLRGNIIPAVSTHIESEIIDSGINQTVHKTKLIMNITCAVLYSGKREKVVFENEYVLAEQVIMGNVPLTSY